MSLVQPFASFKLIDASLFVMVCISAAVRPLRGRKFLLFISPRVHTRGYRGSTPAGSGAAIIVMAKVVYMQRGRTMLMQAGQRNAQTASAACSWLSDLTTVNC